MIPIAKSLVSPLFKQAHERNLGDSAKDAQEHCTRYSLVSEAKMELQSFLSWFETDINTSSVAFKHVNS